MRNDHFGATDEEVFDSLREDIQFADLALASTTARLATALARAEAAESRLEAFDRQLFEIARVVAPLATNSNLTETVREIVSRLARAEEALREIAKDHLTTPGVPGCDDLYSCKWCGGEDDHYGSCPTLIASRALAPEEKEEP